MDFFCFLWRKKGANKSGFWVFLVVIGFEGGKNGKKE
jgi:hypothetical protein